MAKNSIAKNYIYNLLYQILVLILPLITTPYVSKVLGSEMIGIYSYTHSIATYFILFGSLGVSMYAQREIAYVQNDKEKISKIFWEIIILRFITMSISLVVYYFSFVRNIEYQIYYKVLILEILATCLDIAWFFQGLEEFKKTVVRNMIIKTLCVISIFIFVKTRDDLIIYFLIYILSNLIGNLSLWLYLPKYLGKVKFLQLNIKKHLKPTITLFLPQIAMQIYTVLDKTMIGKLLNDMSEVGNYEQSQKIVKIALTIIISLGTVVSPRIASTMSNNKKDEVQRYLANSFKFVWFLGIPIMFGIMVVSSSLVPWFLGEEFDKSVLLLILGAPLIMAIGLNNVSGIQYLIPARKQNIFTKSVVIGAIFNFGLNLILIPILKANGATISSVLAEILILFVQLKYIKEEMPLKMVYQGAMKYFISGIAMLIITMPISWYMKPTILTTMIQVLVGAIVYIIMLVIFKDKFLYDNLNKIKQKIGGGKK